MDCRVCGRQFDPLGYQVMVPGLQHGFDRVDCAVEAGAFEPPATHRVAAAAAVPALPPALAPLPAAAIGPTRIAGTASVRPHLLGGANLALLAAGAAATIYLWLRVFGADAGPFASLAERASQAFGRTSVAAAVDLTPATEIGPEPENTVRGADPLPASAIPVADAPGDGRDAGGNRSPRKEPNEREPPGGPVVRPAPNPPPSEPPSEPGPTRSAPTPTFPVPSSPPDDRVPGPALPGGQNPEQPALPGGRP